LDWLRVLAVGLLVFFHTAVIFDLWSFHIKNPDTSFALTVFVGVVDVWHMPLLFLVSGASTWYALEFRTPRIYVRERLKRLLVPLVFGALVVIPPQIYFQRLQEGLFHGSYLDFYPRFFHGLYPNGNFTWNHLWFLAYLLVFSVGLAPLFARLKTPAGRGRLKKLAERFGRTGAIFWWGLPLALIEGALRQVFPNGNQNLVWDWANFLVYLVLFGYGFVLASDERFRKIVARHGRAALVLGVLATLAGYFILTRSNPYRSWWAGWTYFPILGFNRWFWMIGFLYLGQKYLNSGGRRLAWMAEAALPFYILHQTVIIAAGYYVVQWDAGIAVKFAAIASAGFAGSLLIYEVLIRRVGALRFLFGMKPRPRGA
jgi:peptidoglycan/LPS O-acetylase OafA/YrhL